ncbi:MAG TPA: hypothetical protein VLB02_00350 [Candidatus Paceibacterota bacterium]|nr:hypothetical protein [Candidatus Paceibacterota bacterium]
MEQNMNKNQLPAGKPKSSKTLWFSMLGALLLIILVVAAPRLKRGSDIEAPALDDTELGAGAELSPAPESAAPKVLSRTEAAAKYAGQRMEFSLDCKAAPATVAVKQGATVMLDNQSNKPHTVALAGKLYAIGAYKYRTVTLATLGSFPVACDEAQNAGAFIVQE